MRINSIGAFHIAVNEVHFAYQLSQLKSFSVARFIDFLNKVHRIRLDDCGWIDGWMNEWQQIFHDLLESERYFTLSVDLPKKLPRLYGNKTNDDLKESRSSSYRFTSFCSFLSTPCVSLLACHLFVILINDASPNAESPLTTAMTRKGDEKTHKN